MKINKQILLVVAIIFSLFIVLYISLYVDWNNRTTYVVIDTYSTGENINQEYKLKRTDVALFFEKRFSETGTDALANIPHLPSDKFNFFRELRNKLIAYNFVFTSGIEVLSLPKNIGSDGYIIDDLGMAEYFDFYVANDTDDTNYNAEFLTFYSPSYYNKYQLYLENDFKGFNGYILFHTAEGKRKSIFPNYPMLVDDNKNIYIDVSYIYGKTYFPGEGTKIFLDDKYEVFKISYKDKELLLDDHIAYSGQNIRYKVLKVGNSKYIDINVLSFLYDYEMKSEIILYNEISEQSSYVTDNYPIPFGDKLIPMNRIIHMIESRQKYVLFALEIFEKGAAK